MQSGLDVARIQLFARYTRSMRRRSPRARLRQLASRPVAILGDLQGPRIRVGDLESPVDLHAGDDIVLVPEGWCAMGDPGDLRGARRRRGTVRSDEVLEHRQALAEVGLDRPRR